VKNIAVPLGGEFGIAPILETVVIVAIEHGIRPERVVVGFILWAAGTGACECAEDEHQHKK
jgi:hypothetical protein